MVCLVPLNQKRILPIHYHFWSSGNAQKEDADMMQDFISQIRENFSDRITCYGKAQDADRQYIEHEVKTFERISKCMREHDDSLIETIAIFPAHLLNSADAPHLMKRLRYRATNHDILVTFTNEEIRI